MSWQEYVDDHLLVELPNGGILSAGAIIGQDGGVWAQNDAFPNVEQSEVADTHSMLRSSVVADAPDYTHQFKHLEHLECCAVQCIMP